jgi:hypothetical protein
MPPPLVVPLPFVPQPPHVVQPPSSLPAPLPLIAIAPASCCIPLVLWLIVAPASLCATISCHAPLVLCLLLCRCLLPLAASTSRPLVGCCTTISRITITSRHTPLVLWLIAKLSPLVQSCCCLPFLSAATVISDCCSRPSLLPSCL